MGDRTIPAADGGTYRVNDVPGPLPLLVVHEHPDGTRDVLMHCRDARAVDNLTASVDRIHRASQDARGARDHGNVLAHPGCGIAG